MDPPLSTAKMQKHYHNSQWLKTILRTLCTSPRYCSLCLDTKGELCRLDKYMSIYEKAPSKTLRSVINSIFNFHIDDLIPSGYICESCTEKIIHCHTFIENTKKLYKVIDYCVKDLHSKASDINNELKEDTDYSDANVMIIVEYDTDIYSHIDDLASGQFAVLSDTMKLVPKIEIESMPRTKINSKTCHASRKDSKEMIVAPTPRVVKHPRVEKEDIPKSPSKKSDLIKVTCTPSNILKPIDKKTVGNRLAKSKNEDRQIKNLRKVKKESAKVNLNFTLKDGKLLVLPLDTNGAPSTPRFNTYSCNECLEIFTTYRSLKEHEKTKHNLVTYKCRICFKSYNSQQYLDMHYKTTHSKARCRFCYGLFDSDLNNPDNLNNHLIDEHRQLVFVCKHCDLVYYSHDKLETHVKSTHKTTDLKYSNKKTQCIMCLRNFVDDELLTHKCKFACLDCPVNQKECIHFNYLASYREQVLNNVTKIKCIDCDYTTKRKEHLICHVNREHLDYHPFTCDDCGTQFYTKLSLKSHITQFHQDLKCEFCDTEFRTPKILASHRALCRNVTRQFVCDSCVASFDTEEEFKKHNEVSHSDTVFPCTLCKKEFHNEISLGEHHARVHNGIQFKKRRRLIECTLCDITFSTTREMMEHEKTHDPNEQFPCNVCPKSFPSLKKVYMHKQIHYSLRIKCEGCHKSVSDSFITQHLVMCPYYSGGKEKSFTCEECGKSFRLESNLRIHQKIHLKPEPCVHCGKMIKPSSLKQHMYTKHTDVIEKGNIESEAEADKSKTIELQHCPACEFVTKTKSVLENHINRIHLKIKPYVCPVCKKSFCGKFRLNDHMKTHSSDNSCKCPECGKKLANKVCLKLHMRKHTGEHRYECNICFDRFRTSSIMKTHRMKKHQDKTICCPLCESMFHMATEMRFHVKKTHWRKPGPFDYKQIVPEEYHYMFQDRRFQKLGVEENEIIPLQ